MTDRPLWFAKNEAEREAMVQWMHHKLNEWQAAELWRRSGIDQHRWLQEDGPEIYYAEYYGDIEPLRKKYPHLADFLFAPAKRKLKKLPKDDAIATAVEAVEQIRQIWKSEYDRKNRTKGQRPTAVEIAASWMDVSEEDILKRMKPSGRSGKKLSRAV